MSLFTPRLRRLRSPVRHPDASSCGHHPGLDPEQIMAVHRGLDAIARRRFGDAPASRLTEGDQRSVLGTIALYGLAIAVVAIPTPQGPLSHAQLAVVVLVLLLATRRTLVRVQLHTGMPEFISPRSAFLHGMRAEVGSDVSDVAALAALDTEALTFVEARFAQRLTRLQERFETWMTVPGKNGALVAIVVSATSLLPIATRTLTGAPAWAPMLVLGIAAFLAFATVHSARFNAALVELRTLHDLLKLALQTRERAEKAHTEQAPATPGPT